MAAEKKIEILFYHLTTHPLEQVLPALLQKTLERGWRALVRGGNPLRLKPLSEAIWSWRDDSFIPHGVRGQDGHETMQPVLLADAGLEEAPNGADILFCVDGAKPREEDLPRFSRVCILFPQADAALLEQARELWRQLRERDDVALTYWQQDERGRWQRKA